MIIRGAVQGDIALAAVDFAAQSMGVEVDTVFNQVALTIAERFDDGSMHYGQADAAMNHIWVLMIEHLQRHNDESQELAEPAYSIYEAFDAGEYDHGDGKDPVQGHTRPLIQGILRDA